MSANRVCTAEKDLEKFIKFLALKSAQVVVQSRLGEKIQTQCNPHVSGNDWFNIVIQDHPDVLYETKKALSINSGDSILNRLPLCIEISLQTVEGDKMILEVWSLSLQSEQSDPQLRTAHAIYNRMGILLKSLISVTRATPAYKLSRLQSADSYHIYYRIYVDEPQIHNLGDGYKQVRVGQLSTILGTLNMSVAYRTKMTISPTQTGRDNAIMLKSDHFLKDISPKHIRYHHIKKSEKKKRVIDLNKPLKPGAFADLSRIRQYTEEDFRLPETPVFYWLERKPPKAESSQETSVEDEKSSSNLNSPTDDKNLTATLTAGQAAALNSSPVTDTTATGTTNQTLKTKSEESQKDTSGTSGTSQIPTISFWKPCTAELTGPSSSKPKKSYNDDIFLKELHFPFAIKTPLGELAKFYRDCANAPPLESCKQPPTEDGNVIDDLTKQLEQFEASLEDYDELVKSLGPLDTNLNS